MATNNKNGIILILVILGAFLIYGILTMPDNRTAGERVGDAIDKVSEEGGNLGDAAQELEKRTPGEKLGDAVKDIGDDIKENTSNE